MGNFRVIARELLQQGAAVQVEDAAALAETATGLLRDAARREALAAAAVVWQRANAGAVGRTLVEVREVLGRHSPS